MADNVPITPGSGRNVATDQVSYSGDTADVQLIRVVRVSGSEGSKTVDDQFDGDQTLGYVRIDPVDNVVKLADNLVFGDITTQNLVPNDASGTAGSYVEAGSGNGYATAIIQVTGTYTGALTPQGNATNEGPWVSLLGPLRNVSTGAASSTIPSGATGMWAINIAGAAFFRITALGAVTGTAELSIYLTPAHDNLFINGIKPDGTNTMPSLDAAARRGYVQITDGSNSPDISTAGADATSNTANRMRVAGFNYFYNGSTWDRVRGDATNGLVAQGSAAHDAIDSGNPVKIGYRAIAHGANPTAVAAADRSDGLCNRAGVPFTIGGHPNIITLKHTTVTTAVTDAAVISVGAGTKIVVTAFMFTLDNASTVFPTVLLGFGTANTPTTTGVLGAHGGVPAGGGFGRGDGSGILGIGADGEDLRLTTTGNATGNGLQLVVTYYTIES